MQHSTDNIQSITGGAACRTVQAACSPVQAAQHAEVQTTCSPLQAAQHAEQYRQHAGGTLHAFKEMEAGDCEQYQRFGISISRDLRAAL
jgi:hypothetical protein